MTLMVSEEVNLSFLSAMYNSQYFLISFYVTIFMGPHRSIDIYISFYYFSGLNYLTEKPI